MFKILKFGSGSWRGWGEQIYSVAAAKIGRVLGEVCNWKDGKILDKEITMYYIVIMTLKLVWDEWNREHIKKHGVAVNEVEEVYKAKIVVRESYLGRRLILGKTRRGRLLTIIVSLVKQKEAYVVSARDMSKKERRLYYEKTKTNRTI